MNCNNTPKCKEPCGDCTQEWPRPDGSEAGNKSKTHIMTTYRLLDEDEAKAAQCPPWHTLIAVQFIEKVRNDKQVGCSYAHSNGNDGARPAVRMFVQGELIFDYSNPHLSDDLAAAMWRAFQAGRTSQPFAQIQTHDSDVVMLGSAKWTYGIEPVPAQQIEMPGCAPAVEAAPARQPAAVQSPAEAHGLTDPAILKEAGDRYTSSTSAQAFVNGALYARAVLAANVQPKAAEAHGNVLVPLAVLEDASSAIGNFVSDHGWGDSDMQAMDNLDAYIARHKANVAANAQQRAHGMVLIEATWLEALKNDINTLAALSLKADRHSVGAALKQSIADALAAAPNVQPKGTAAFNGWYCAHCQRGVDSSEVTYHEQHTVCGRVITDDVPPAQAPAPAPGPVAYRYWDSKWHDWTYTTEQAAPEGRTLEPLYAAPCAAVVDGKPFSYSSTQATNCASCGKHKHTPLRIDAMGGYVCLTCIDKKLGGLLGEFGYEDDQQRVDAEKYRHWRDNAEVICAVLRYESPVWIDAYLAQALAERDAAHPPVQGSQP